MDQDRNHGKKCSVFKRIKYFLTRQVRMDARLLDFMQEHPEIAPDSDLLEAPPGEFQKILAEMDKRGIKPAVKRQVKLKNSLTNAGRYVHRPAFVALLVVLIIGGTSVGTSAKKAYDYRVRETAAGKSNIVWNNDQYVIQKNEGIEEVYKEIENSLGIKALKISVIPIEMKYDHLEIKEGIATMKFTFKDRLFCFVQAKNNVASSNNVVSDRDKSNEIYNLWLDKTIVIEKNELPNDRIEYSTYLEINGAYYYLYGIMEKDEFENIVSELRF